MQDSLLVSSSCSVHSNITEGTRRQCRFCWEHRANGVTLTSLKAKQMFHRTWTNIWFLLSYSSSLVVQVDGFICLSFRLFFQSFKSTFCFHRIWDFPVCCPGSVRCVKLFLFPWDGNTELFLCVLLSPVALLRRAVSFLKWSALFPELQRSFTLQLHPPISLSCVLVASHTCIWSKSQMRLDAFCAKSELMSMQAMVYVMCWSKLPRKHSG